MPFWTIASIAVFVGFVVISRLNINSEKKDNQQSITPTPSTTSQLTPTNIPKSTSTPTTEGKSSIKIDVDTSINDINSIAEKLIYPGAVKISTSTDSEIYETNSDGETVYNWFKAEFEKRSYNILNNVKTKANEKFKAVLQGVSASSSLKVTIDQENSGTKTIITIE